ncbi:MAG TPA: hypothetical protein VLT33_47425 [Labilithrix sp.]|nr:hypothetical protein [Labilithrix sp.]
MAKTPALRAFFLTLLASLGAVYGFNATFSTSAPPLDVTARFAAEQTETDVIVSDNTLYQRGWTRARLVRPPTAEQPCADLVVLGSSATGTLASEMFPGRRMLNGWHGNFSVQDMESYTAILEAAPCKPKDIIVGVDIFWSSNASWKFEGWQQLASDYAAYHAAHGGFAAYVPVQVRWDEYKENLGFERTIDTLRSAPIRGFRTDAIGRAGLRRVALEPLERLCESVAPREQNLRAWDGHYLKCPASEMSESGIVRYATDYLATNTHNMADWHELDTSRLERIERVIAAWRKLGFGVAMVGIPYHPITWKLLTTDPVIAPNIRELEQRLERLSQSTGAAYVSLRDPSTAPCTADEFEDSHHPRAICTQRVAAKALAALEAKRAAPAAP